MLTYFNIIRLKLTELYEEECSINEGCLTKEEFTKLILTLNDMQNYFLDNFDEEFKPLISDEEGD